MFLFGSGSQGQPASEDVHQQLVDKDEEIDELKAKILALRDALEKEPHFEHFEMAMNEKNKVLEEQFARVEELQKENNALKERLEHSTPESAPSKGPECSQTMEASVVQSAEATAAFSKVEALEGQLTMAMQEIEELRASSNVEDAQRVCTENLELRSRLAHAIYCSTEAQKAVAAQNGRPAESVEDFHLRIEDNALPVGAMFAPREARVLGHGWQVNRVRENSWAEQQGVLAGDELHYIEGHPVEVLPEAEVMGLLQQRPVTLTWLRRKAAATPEEPEDTAVPPQADHVSELQVQNQQLQEQLQRLSMELGKVQNGEAAEQLDVLTANKNQASEMQSTDQLSRIAELEKELQLAAETAAKVDHYEQLKMNMERELEETTAKNQMLQERLDVLTANKNQASEMQSADQLSRIAELEKELQLAAETAAKVEQYQYEQLMEMERKLEETSERNEMLEEQLKVSTVTAEGLKDAPEMQAETLSASTRIAELEKEVEQYEQLKMDMERELEETTARNQTLQEQKLHASIAKNQELQERLDVLTAEKNQASQMQSAEHESASARVAELEQELQMAGAMFAQVEQLKMEMEQKLHASIAKNQELQERLDVLTAEKNQASQMQSADHESASARVAELEQELQMAGAMSAQYQEMKMDMEHKLEETTARNQTLQEQLNVLEVEKSQASEMQASAVARIADLEKELQTARDASAKDAAPRKPSTEAGDSGWGDFDFDGIQTTPVQKPAAQPTSTSQHPQGGEGGWDEFGLDLLEAPHGGDPGAHAALDEPQDAATKAEDDGGDGWDDFDLEDSKPKVAEMAGATSAQVEQLQMEMEQKLQASLVKNQELQEQLDTLTAEKQAFEMQSAEHESASARVAELEQELRMAGAMSAQVAQYDDMKMEMEQKLEQTAARNQTLQEQLNTLTAEKNQASEMQAAAVARIADLEKELHMARDSSAKVLEEAPIQDKAPRKPSTEGGDNGWGDFDFDGIQTTPVQQPLPEPISVSQHPEGEGGWDEFGLDLLEANPQPNGGDPGDGWGDFDLEDSKPKVAEMAGATAAQVEQLKVEMEQKLKNSVAKNKELQEQLDALTAEKNQASEMQSAEHLSASARVAELEQELQMAGATSAQDEAPRKPSTDGGDNGWGDFDFDGIQTTPVQQPVPEPTSVSQHPEEGDQGGWDEFGLDLLETNPQPNGGDPGAGASDLLDEPQVEQLLKVDMEQKLQASLAKNKELQEQLDALKAKNQASEMQSAEHLSASARVADLEQELQAAEATSAKVAQYEELKMEMEQKLEETFARNQMLQEQMNALTAEKNQALEMQAAEQLAASVRISDLEKELQMAREASAKVQPAAEAPIQMPECVGGEDEAARRKPSTEGGDNGWGDFDFGIQTTPVQQPVPEPTSAHPEEGHGDRISDPSGPMPNAEVEPAKAQAAGDDGWGDFDFDGLEAAPVQEPASSQQPPREGSDGWDDFDFGDDSFNAPAPAPAQEPDVGKIQKELEKSKRELREAKEALDLQKKAAAQALELQQQEAACAAAQLEDARRRLEELGASEAVSASSESAPAPAVSMFSTASRLLGTATSVAAAARAAAEQISQISEERPKEAGTGGQSGWETDFGTSDAGAARKHLEDELEVLKSRLAMAHDQLQAERKAQGAMKALSSEVTSLSEVLARERQDHEREKVHLKEQIRQAKSDLRQSSSPEGNGLLKQLEIVRRQRDQARSIAQLVARQLSGSSPRLSSPASREASPQASEAVDPPADPERTLLETSGDVGTEPLPATEHPAAAEPATEDVALPVDEGDEGSVPRPPVEITSGWDVFNPDDQLEHTIPTGLSAAALPQSDAAATAQDGWGDFDFDALM